MSVEAIAAGQKEAEWEMERDVTDITADFVDERFRAWVREHCCEGRERIRKCDVEHITVLQLSDCLLTNLQGIEHFGSLKELDCSFNGLRKLDVNANSALEHLNCCWNLLSRLELAGNPALVDLNCGYNRLFGLDLAANTRLVRLDCGSNQLVELELGGCAQLEELRCNHNHLTALDVSGNPALTRLRCFNNHIAVLDLSRNRQLTALYCSQNKLARLDTEGLPHLDQLSYGDNLMVEPDYPIDEVGVFQYDSSLSYYSATVVANGSEVSMRTDAAASGDMERLTPLIQQAWTSREALQQEALARIGEAHPDEDPGELVLAELVFEKEGGVQLGYDAGASPAGQLYIYVLFNEKLEPVGDLVYETY